MGAIDDIKRHVSALDADALASLLDRHPAILRDNPRFGVEMLVLALRMISVRGDMTARGEQARAEIESNRHTFDVLLQAGAPPDCAEDEIDTDLPPLHVAMQLTHPVLLEELLRRGARPERTALGIRLADMNNEPAHHEVLARFQRDDDPEPG